MTPGPHGTAGGEAPSFRLAAPIAYLLLLAGLIVAAWVGRERARAVPDIDPWSDLIVETARSFEVDPNLLRGLVAVESSGNPNAVSRVGAVGLMQLMPPTAEAEARRLRVTGYSTARLTEPALNLRLGTSYLSRLLVRYEGEVAFALAAYNAGPTRVERWREQAPHLSARDVIRAHGYKETRAHVERVLRLRAAYREKYGP